MMSVGKLLQDKGSEVWSTGPDATVFEALQLMAEKNIGALLVLEGDELVGMLSERDYARKVVLADKSSKETRVSEIMTPRVICVRAEQGIDECMALMTAKDIRHLPVLGDDNRVVGVISMRDVGKAIIARQEFRIAQLEHYIAGSDSLGFRSS